MTCDDFVICIDDVEPTKSFEATQLQSTTKLLQLAGTAIPTHLYSLLAWLQLPLDGSPAWIGVLKAGQAKVVSCLQQ